METVSKGHVMGEAQYQSYFESLISGNKRACFRIVKELHAQGVSLEDIYLKLFQRSLYHVGESWETGKLSIATEHIATAITDYLISQCFGFLEPAPANGLSVVMSCMGQEYHQLGARIVADLIEAKGFDVLYLGANSPQESVLEAIETHQPIAAGFSLSLPQNIDALERMVDAIIRKNPALDILLGGQAFRWISPSFLEYDHVHVINTIPLLYQTLNEIEKNAA